MISSYLSNRYQCVEYNDKVSRLLAVPCGVPQGSLMGPLLFSLCINGLPNQLEPTTDRGLYADDFQFIIHGNTNDISGMILRANIELSKLCGWFDFKKLRLNAKKSLAMFVSCNEVDITDDLPKIRLDGNEISIVEHAKNLGLYLDDSLVFERHINELIKKVYFSLHSLKINKLCLSSEMKLKLVKALVIPHFLYCDVIISCVNSRLKLKLEKAFKCIIRFCFNLRKRESTRKYASVIFGCTFWNYLNYRLTMFIFKIINFKEPKYLYDKLEFSKSNRTCNLIMPKFSHRQRNMFSVRSAKIWNSLPNEIKRLNNLGEFEKASFEYHSQLK